MDIGVDLGLCQGHAQCEDAAPDVFQVRDDGVAHVVLASTEDDAVIARVRDASRRCPVDAILTAASRAAAK